MKPEERAARVARSIGITQHPKHLEPIEREITAAERKAFERARDAAARECEVHHDDNDNPWWGSACLNLHRWIGALSYDWRRDED